MKIDVTLPGLIADSVGWRHLTIDADTVADALMALRKHPQVGPLVFDDAGRVRQHVLVFHNDTATKHMDSLDVPLKPGDRIAVVQAVSGG